MANPFMHTPQDSRWSSMTIETLPRFPLSAQRSRLRPGAALAGAVGLRQAGTAGYVRQRTYGSAHL